MKERVTEKEDRERAIDIKFKEMKAENKALKEEYIEIKEKSQQYDAIIPKHK